MPKLNKKYLNGLLTRKRTSIVTRAVIKIWSRCGPVKQLFSKSLAAVQPDGKRTKA